MWYDFNTGSYQTAKKAENMLVICPNKAKLDFNDTEHAPANYTPANQQTHQFTE